ncbi:hypothetical protein [Hyunsoonleella pacifica]|uniref:hypothetical protein n=1 Tax=Hyunsoonleella pacifica TaxID=1080224 RepID=UPI0019AE015D|nr:hypothetical protein [Hyunsoonleella pacifica]GGD06403.1 hypothetical protein GCM10011368_05340 [Hyunsoonleella pacifica]
MIEFLLSNYIQLTFTVEIIAALTGVIYYNKYKTTPVKYFIYFLVFISLADILGVYSYYVKPNGALGFLIGTKFEKNHWWTNTYWVIGAPLFICFYYRQILNTEFFKKVLKYSSYLFFIFSICFVITNWEAFFHSFFIILNLTGAVLITISAVFFFVEILSSEDILVFYKSINFYITAVIFIWWLIITPLTFYDIYFKYEIGVGHIDKEFMFLRHKIYLFANIFMYLTYTFAFIWCKPENEL